MNYSEYSRCHNQVPTGTVPLLLAPVPDNKEHIARAGDLQYPTLETSAGGSASVRLMYNNLGSETSNVDVSVCCSGDMTEGRACGRNGITSVSAPRKALVSLFSFFPFNLPHPVPRHLFPGVTPRPYLYNVDPNCVCRLSR